MCVCVCVCKRERGGGAGMVRRGGLKVSVTKDRLAALAVQSLV